MPVDFTKLFNPSQQFLQNARKPTGGGMMPPTVEGAPLEQTPAFDWKNVRFDVSKANVQTTQLSGGGSLNTGTDIGQPVLTKATITPPTISKGGKKNIQKAKSSGFGLVDTANASEEIDDRDMKFMKQLKEQGYSADDAFEILSQVKQPEVTNTIEPTTTEASKEEGGIFTKAMEGAKYVGQGIQNVVGGVVSEVPKIAADVASIPVDIAGGRYFGTPVPEAQKFAEDIRGAGQTGKEFVKKYGAYEPESTGAKVGEFGAGVASTLIGPGKVFKTAENANTAIKALAGAANVSLDGTIAAVQNYATTEGRLPTADEVKNFIITGGILKGAGKVAEKLSSIPTARVVPTTITEAGKDISRGLDIGKTIRDTGISLTKSSLVSKIDKKVTGLSNDVDSAIQSVVKSKGPSSVTIDDITSGLKEKILNNPEYKKKLQGTPIDMADIEDGIQETIDSYKKLYGKKPIPLPDQQQLKKDIYTGLSASFKKADTAKLSARQVTEKEMAKILKENIESKVPEVKALNEQLAPLLEAGNRLRAKGAYSSYLTDIIAGGFASGNPTTILQDPVGYAKNFATGVIVKRLGTSTAAKTTAATILNNLNKLFENKVFIRAIQDQAKSLNSNNQ